MQMVFRFCFRFEGTVKHIIISQGQDGCYGLADNCRTHKTLSDLVLHYYNNSLSVHNNVLKITLKFPLGLR